jgi:hypothetical protein
MHFAVTSDFGNLPKGKSLKGNIILFVKSSVCLLCMLINAMLCFVYRIVRWWHHETVDRATYRTCNRRILSRCAAEKAQRREKQRQDAHDLALAQAELERMQGEEQHMLQHLAFTEAVDFVQEVVEDVFDASWGMIRKLALARRKLHKQTTVPRPAATASVAVPPERHPAPVVANSGRKARSVRWSDGGAVEGAPLSTAGLGQPLPPA